MNKEIISYEELVSKTSSNSISYLELLHTKEWKEKRQIIIDRDNHHCLKCGKGETISHYDEVSGRTFHLWWTFTEIYSFDIDVIPNIEASAKPYHLQVHHLFYIVDKLPWEYQDNFLVTLCNWCHWEFHEKNTVEIYIEENDELINCYDIPTCKRCNGAGWFPQYKHVNSGVCFECGGAKFEKPIFRIKRLLLLS